jgi:hypothetical protein
VEIKRAGTFSQDFTKGLKYWNTISGKTTVLPIIVYSGETETAGRNYRLINWKQVNTVLWPGEKA